MKTLALVVVLCLLAPRSALRGETAAPPQDRKEPLPKPGPPQTSIRNSGRTLARRRANFRRRYRRLRPKSRSAASNPQFPARDWLLAREKERSKFSKTQNSGRLNG